LNDLLEDFLSLGKLEEGKITASAGSFNIREFFEEVTDEMKPILKPGQDIETNITGGDIFLTDKRLLKNILINLLGNATKFSAENSTVELNVTNSSDVLTLAVRDHGIGISQEDQQHLFSSFFRGRNAVNIQGTGLGLHIVKRYAELISGTLALESVLGEGTTITLHLPLLAGPATGTA
jgi:signal transduction histidine kinase